MGPYWGCFHDQGQEIPIRICLSCFHVIVFVWLDKILTAPLENHVSRQEVAKNSTHLFCIKRGFTCAIC